MVKVVLFDESNPCHNSISFDFISGVLSILTSIRYWDLQAGREHSLRCHTAGSIDCYLVCELSAWTMAEGRIIRFGEGVVVAYSYSSHTCRLKMSQEQAGGNPRATSCEALSWTTPLGIQAFWALPLLYSITKPKLLLCRIAGFPFKPPASHDLSLGHLYDVGAFCAGHLWSKVSLL
jgi:hypothetical protein